MYGWLQKEKSLTQYQKKNISQECKLNVGTASLRFNNKIVILERHRVIHGMAILEQYMLNNKSKNYCFGVLEGIFDNIVWKSKTMPWERCKGPSHIKNIFCTHPRLEQSQSHVTRIGTKPVAGKNQRNVSDLLWSDFTMKLFCASVVGVAVLVAATVVVAAVCSGDNLANSHRCRCSCNRCSSRDNLAHSRRCRRSCNRCSYNSSLMNSRCSCSSSLMNSRCSCSGSFTMVPTVTATSSLMGMRAFHEDCKLHLCSLSMLGTVQQFPEFSTSPYISHTRSLAVGGLL